MSLLRLPMEVLFMVRSYLINESDTNSLTRVNKHLYMLFIDFSYISDIRSGIKKALFWSVFHGQKEPLRRLIRLGVDVNLQKLPWTTEILNSLLPGGKIPRIDGIDGIDHVSHLWVTSALRIAAHKGDVAMLKLLLEAGAKVEVGNFENNPSPLALAIEYNHTESFNLLLDAMPDEFLHKEEGSRRMTPLHLASLHHRPEMVQVLLSKGAVIDTKDKKHRTPLACAIHSGGHYICELDGEDNLIIHHRLSPPTTPAMVETIKLLLAAGADPSGRALSFSQSPEAKWTKNFSTPKTEPF